MTLTVHDFPLSREVLEEWEGLCLELVDELLHSHPEGRVLYIELAGHPRWTWHAALLLDGVVYDAWKPFARLGPEDHVKTFYPEAVSWEVISSEAA